jgi:hypothetical protein
LLLIPGDHFDLEKPMVAEAVKAGHHVLIQRPYSAIRTSSGIRLPRADRWEVQRALESAGFLEARASRLAREAGGCLSVLVRLASQFAGQAMPEWSLPQEAAPLLPLVLIGAWSDQNEGNRKLVERFTGRAYENAQQLATRWMNHPDSPLRLGEGVYSFVSREESWQMLSPLFTSDLLNRFEKFADEILGEDDPRFDMPVGERYLAGIYKKLPKLSYPLREGIAETIALLGTRGEHTPQGTPGGSGFRAARLVRRLLYQAPARRWFSLAHCLPLLAEAAPDEFLSALEADLQQSAPDITTLFEKDAAGFWASSPHTSLMWALELLAWDTTHLSRVVLVLAGLIKLDTGGRTHPRPAGVMFDIFRFWFPQTSATISERLQVLDLLSRREPDAAWSLLLGLIPRGDDTALASYKPRWRDCDTSQTKEITHGDIKRQVEWAAARLTQVAEVHPEKWPLFLKDFEKLPPAAQDATLKWLREVDIAPMLPKARSETWEQVRDSVRKHRFFHNAWWAMPKSTVDTLAGIEQKFAPSDPIARSKWLFASDTLHSFGNMEMPIEERERLHAEAQAHAVRDVFENLGLEGIFDLGTNTHTQSCINIGGCLARSGLLRDWSRLLPDNLLSKDIHKRNIALGYAAARRAVEGDAWVENLPLERWPAEAVGEFALILNFDRSAWQMLRRRNPDAETFYWRRVHPWAGRLSEDELEEAIKALLQNGRPMVAVNALFAAIHNHKKPSWRIVADAVDLASTSPVESTDSNFNTMSVFEICEVMKYLQADSTMDQERLVVLEWGLLPLAKHDDFEPKTLHAELSRNAAFFAEVLSSIYHPKDQPKDKTPDPTKRRLAEAAHDLLESWTGIPGSRSDGVIDAKVLNDWVNEARKICTANGRIEACDEVIGEQLSYAPLDADDSWPCQPVRDILEAVTTDEILRGFDIGVFNQRRVTSRSLNAGGEQERELVKKYGAYAEKCKVEWPRTAFTLRRIAAGYEAEAKGYDERAETRD